MGDLVNLRTARKRKARAEADRKAHQNRILHGQTKSQRAGQKTEAARHAALLEGHRREAPEPQERS